MRSRQTGQVGSSTRDGVGGGSGFVATTTAVELAESDVGIEGRGGEAENGSLGVFGYVVSVFESLGMDSGELVISTDFRKTTWHVSGSILLKTFPFQSCCHLRASFP